MKLRHSNLAKTAKLTVANAPKRFLVDRAMLPGLAVHAWRYMPLKKWARATVGLKQPRELLHRYIALVLMARPWAEVFFENNDPFDCRSQNLKPYRRSEEGSRRCSFRNKRIKSKGVSLRSGNAKKPYQASIRVKRRLKHIGYFETEEQAAKAYLREHRLAHPDLKI